MRLAADVDALLQVDGARVDSIICRIARRDAAHARSSVTVAFGAGPGFTIFSNDGIGIEALVKYNYARSKFDIDIAGEKTTTTTKTNQIALSLGVQFYFSGLRK